MIFTPQGKKILTYLFWAILSYAIFGPTGLAIVALVVLWKEGVQKKSE